MIYSEFCFADTSLLLIRFLLSFEQLNKIIQLHEHNKIYNTKLFYTIIRSFSKNIHVI